MARIGQGTFTAEGSQRVERSANLPNYKKLPDGSKIAPLTTGSRNANRERSQQIYKTGQASIASHIVHPLNKNLIRQQDKQFLNNT